MMKARIFFFACFASFLFVSMVLPARAQGAAFTYQGRLVNGGFAANGTYDLTFGLYTNASGGNPTGTLITNSTVAVSNGLFTAALNFGNVFNGASYWIEIGVRTNGGGAFTTLSPRQAITPAPYAVTASNLTGVVSISQLPPAVVLANTNQLFSGTNLFTGGNNFSGIAILTNAGNVFAGNGGGLTGLVTPTQSNFINAYDTTIQYAVAANSFQQVGFNTLGQNSAWGYLASGIFTAATGGVYVVQYSAHVQNAAPANFGTLTAGLRAVINGNFEVIGSGSAATVAPVFGISLLSKSFIVQLTAGQTLSFQWTSNLAGNYAYLLAGSFNGEMLPSASVTIIRIQ